MEHKKSNIKAVYFSFRETSVMEPALEATASYRPSQIADMLQRNYVLDTDAARGQDIDLHLSCSTEKNGTLRVLAYSHQDVTADDFDFNQAAAQLADFTISLPSAMGGKDWNYYLEEKSAGTVFVATPYEAKKGDEDHDNLHHHLADRLKRTLVRHGLRNFGSPEDTGMEIYFVGMLLDHHKLAKNPRALDRAIEIRLESIRNSL